MKTYLTYDRHGNPQRVIVPHISPIDVPAFRPSPRNAREWAAEIQADPGASHWLKAALTALLNRDPVDALNDVELLHRVIQQNCAEVLR